MVFCFGSPRELIQSFIFYLYSSLHEMRHTDRDLLLCSYVVYFSDFLPDQTKYTNWKYLNKQPNKLSLANFSPSEFTFTSSYEGTK